MVGQTSGRSSNRFQIPKEKIPLVREKPELYLSLIGDPLPKPLSKDKTKQVFGSLYSERRELESKYHSLMRENLVLRRLVTYVPNKGIPVYNWFKYKEGFSRALISTLLDVLKVQKRDVVFDPFAGCGTTLLACKELGYPAVGIDILPIAVYVAQVKLQNWRSLDALIDGVNRLLSTPRHPPKTHFPNVKIIKHAFPLHVQEEILFFKEEIEKFPKPVCDFLMLGLISILEKVSFTSKDGQFLRLVSRSIPPVKDVLRQQLTLMLSDLCQQQQNLFKVGEAKVDIFKGDARDDCLPKKYHGKIGAVITSPPYLNRYDYSRTYALELCLLSVSSFSDLREIRHSLLRSHIESKEHKGKDISLPALDEILLCLQEKELNNERIPIMIRGYFEDMNLVIGNLKQYLKPRGKVALVVANAQFEGEMVPTDLLLSELASQHGLVTRAIWITRYKGNSSQQMAKYGRVPVRESIVFWEKPA
jgi:site-specific DNA-methyltransferase (cytosine-N4-specific)